MWLFWDGLIWRERGGGSSQKDWSACFSEASAETTPCRQACAAWWHGRTARALQGPAAPCTDLADESPSFACRSSSLPSLPASPACSYKGYFVDLFVRASNTTAITMYQKLGYTVFRCVEGRGCHVGLVERRLRVELQRVAGADREAA